MTFPRFSHPDRFGYLNCTEKCALECVAGVSKMDTFNSNKSRQDNNNRHMK